MMDGDTRIRRGLRLSRWALLWERLWAAAWAAVSVAGFALALALADVLPLLPGWLHAVVLVGLAVAFVAALVWGFRGFRLPTALEARARLERQAPHRPLTAAADRLGTPGDPIAEALWRAHAERMAAAARALHAQGPHPGVAARDPHALRFVPVLALTLALVVGWQDPGTRLLRAVSPAIAGPGSDAVVEAWVTPPTYTGMAPVYRKAGPEDPATDPGPLQVPEGSTLLVLVQGTAGAHVALDGEALDGTAAGPEALRVEASLPATEGSERLTVRAGFRTLAEWDVTVVPDAAPDVVFLDTPQEARQWRLKVPLEAVDDYGITALELTLSRGEETETVALPLPSGAPRHLQTAPLLDLTPHRWAGLTIEGTLTATDAQGQTARSASVAFVLPERAFEHPVAQEIVRRRKQLVVDADSRFAVSPGLDALAARPSAFGGDPVVFLGLRVASLRLRQGAEDDVRPVVDLLWDLALRVEEGGLAEARQQVAQAERELKQALEDGSTEDVRRALQRLQQAVAEMMRELARRMPGTEDMDLPEMPQDALNALDFQKMMEEMQDLSDIGAREAAQRMMDQLSRMLQALRDAQPVDQQAMQQMQQTMQALSQITKEQEALLDESFQRGKESRRGEQAEAGDLAERQQELRRRLGDILSQLAERTGEVPQGLGKAELEMRQAGQALADGDMGPAQEAQGRALEALRQGRGQALSQMMQQMGQGMMALPMPGMRGRDPLGRPGPGPLGMNPDETKVPTKPERTRAHDLLQELRRRANEADRGRDERDYLQRLLDRF